MAKGLAKSLRWTAYVATGLLLVLAIAAWSAQYWLKGWIEDTVGSRTGRELQIEDLDIDWSLKPLVTASGIRFANASWAEQDQMATAEQMSVRLSLLALLRGKVVLPQVNIHGADLLLQRGPEERSNWIFGDRQRQDDRQPDLPEIGRLQIADTNVRYIEAERDTDIGIAVRADPDAAPGKTLTAEGQGQYRGEPFTLEFHGDPPLDLLTPGDPYDIRLAVAAADTEATLVGQILDPRAIKASDLDLELTLSGPDPSRLYKLVDLPLPSLPPYEITGRLIRNGESWKLSNFDGRVGDSDLHGDIGLALQNERPMLTAELRSESLRFKDLGSLVGADPTNEANGDDVPQQDRDQDAAEGRALPEKRADLSQLRSIDAAVQFRGEQVRAGKLPIDEVHIHFKLDHGQMQFDPLRFGAGGGRVDARITADASGEELDAQIDGEFVRLDLKRLLADLDIADDSVGTVGGRAKLWMKGNSTAALLGSADGGLYLIMTGGRLDHILVELAGLDIGEAVLTKLTGGERTIPINCGYADMKADNGVLQLNNFVIDSSDTLFTASGTVNLRTEELDVEINPNPKDVSLFAVRSKLQIGGTLSDPQVRPGTATLVKGAASAALAAVAGPAAALVPLIETGGGKKSAACDSFSRAVDAGAVDAAQQRESQ